MSNSSPTDLEMLANYDAYVSMRHLHEAALKIMQIKFEVLNDEIRIRTGRPPIQHIETRVKSTSSIISKLRKRGMEVSMRSAQENLNDIAGIRVICSYIDDVYAVAEMLVHQTDVTVVKTQDYIRTPNFNGYRSLHLDIRVPVYLSDHQESVGVEVQIRTIAMDFWASLEHDLRYKSNCQVPEHISKAMLEASEDIARIDQKMQDTYREIRQLSQNSK